MAELVTLGLVAGHRAVRGFYSLGSMSSSSSSSSSSFSSCSSSSVSSSCSSSSGAIRYVVSRDTWRAVTVVFNDPAPVQLIFIIDDYEEFFRDPINNGTFKYVEQDTLTRAWVDRENLIFTWEQAVYDDGTVVEAPVIGSHKEAFGALKDLIAFLKDNIS